MENQESTSEQQSRRKRRKESKVQSSTPIVEAQSVEKLTEEVVEAKEVDVTKEDDSKSFTAEIDIDLSELPSRGIPYPENATLKYRTYTFGEVQKSSISNMSALQSVKMALAGIDCTGMDKHQLTLFDLMYLGILRKVSSMSEMKFTMPYVCRGCGSTTTGNFTHRDIDFKDLDEEVTELPISVELGGRDFKFSPMTVKDFLELYQGRYSNYVKKGEVDKVAVYAIMVKNMDFKDAYAILKSTVDPEEIETLAEVDQLLLHDMKPLIATCQEKDLDGDKCETENALKLEGREALLRPFRDGRRSPRTKIRIGNKQLS